MPPKSFLRPRVTLALVLQAIIGEEVVVELRNETALRGSLQFADNDLK